MAGELRPPAHVRQLPRMRRKRNIGTTPTGGRAMFDFGRFRLDPKQGRLAERLAELIDAAVRCDQLRRGERLPTVAQWAEALGVSEFVPRRAMGLLAKRGVLEVKRHVGATVSFRRLHSQRKTVVFLSVDRGDVWARNVFSFRLGEELRRAGFGYERVVIAGRGTVGRHASREFSLEPVEDALKGDVAFAWVECSRAWVTSPLLAAGVPFAVADTGDEAYPGAVDVFRVDGTSMADELVRRLVSAGVSTVAVVGPGPEVTDHLSSHVYASGLGFRRIAIDLSGKPRTPESWQRQAMKTFDKMLSAGRNRLPDAFFFLDDGIAAGAILALGRHGIEAPRDVRIVTFSNKGLGPVYFRPLARFESNPERNAAEVARYIEARLKGCAPHLPDLARRFIPGATL